MQESERGKCVREGKGVRDTGETRTREGRHKHEQEEKCTRCGGEAKSAQEGGRECAKDTEDKACAQERRNSYAEE